VPEIVFERDVEGFVRGEYISQGWRGAVDRGNGPRELVPQGRGPPGRRRVAQEEGEDGEWVP
jgi:hypothetical protein